MSETIQENIDKYMNSDFGNKLELARAYFLIQKYSEGYNPEEAMMKGTMYPELYRPYEKHDMFRRAEV